MDPARVIELGRAKEAMRLAHRLGDTRLSSQWAQRAAQLAIRAGAGRAAELENERAKLAQRAGRIVACRHHAGQALRANPHSADINEEAAEIMLHWGDRQRAAACLSRPHASDNAPPNPKLLLRQALLAIESGQTEEALALAEQILAVPRISASLQVSVGEVFLDLFDTSAAERCFHRALEADPRETHAHLALARVHLMRGHTDAAREHAQKAGEIAPTDVHVRLVQALVRLAQPSFSAADLAHFDAAVEAFPRQAELRGLRAQARRRCGDTRGAVEDLITAKHSGTEAQNFIFDLEMTAIGQQFEGAPSIEALTAWARSGQTALAPEPKRNSFVREFQGMGQAALAKLLWTLPDVALEQIGNRMHDRFRVEEGELAMPESLRLRLMTRLCPDELLRMTCGNRSSRPTYVDPYTDQLLPLRLRRSSRHVAKTTQWSLLYTTPDEVLKAFGEIERQYPRSHHPYAYRGEVLLWLGRYDEAAVDFEKGLRINSKARWIHIGMGAVYGFQGRTQAALASFQRSVDVAPQFVGPTLYAYRGEALRIAGQTREALRDLQIACRDNPSRIGAWVNLWLPAQDLGDESEQNRAWDELVTRAPFLLSDAAEERFSRSIYEVEHSSERRNLLEYVLGMMRGNRSSSCVTYFTRTNELRVVNL